ncbi:hypothetical protein [Shouchella shacheensis]|uniref:hypothetical protein n=1 Tax=Shouchella shacheensis TaxID=1649580 RepID=UPI0015D5DE46|nr:hypothetical protein [Shouchella shacheensis]
MNVLKKVTPVSKRKKAMVNGGKLVIAFPVRYFPQITTNINKREAYTNPFYEPIVQLGRWGYQPLNARLTNPRFQS